MSHQKKCPACGGKKERMHYPEISDSDKYLIDNNPEYIHGGVPIGGDPADYQPWFGKCETCNGKGYKNSG